MTLKALARRLGLTRLAARLGVTPATVRRWLRHGPSAKGRERVGAVAKRAAAAARRQRAKEAAAHEAAQAAQEAAERRSRAASKAAATRRQRRGFRDQLPIPVSPVLDLRRPGLGKFDDPSVLIPNARPIDTREQLRDEMRREGHDLGRRIDTDAYFGEKKWTNVGKPIVEVSQRFVLDTALKIWDDANRRWCSCKMLFFRYIPFNPLYKGELLENNGKWRPWWTSTVLCASPGALENSLDVSMSPAYESAQSRLIWFEGFRTDTFDFRTNEAATAYFERQLRTS